MVLDRGNMLEIAQALLRAREEKDGGNLLESVAQTSTASGDGSYGEPVFGGTRFFSASQPGVTTDDKAARRSHKLIPTTRPHPFRDLAGFSYAGEVADTTQARGIPAHDQLAFNEASSTSSWLANPQTTYGRPLAVNAGAASQRGYWDSFWERLFPSYCTPTDDNPTFPPLINQDKEQLTEADKAACHEQFEHDQQQCYRNYNYDPGALNRCFGRAVTIRDLCLRGERETSPWNDFDEDGVRFPRPRKR